MSIKLKSKVPFFAEPTKLTIKPIQDLFDAIAASKRATDARDAFVKQLLPVGVSAPSRIHINQFINEIQKGKITKPELETEEKMFGANHDEEMVTNSAVETFRKRSDEYARRAPKPSAANVEKAITAKIQDNAVAKVTFDDNTAATIGGATSPASAEGGFKITTGPFDATSIKASRILVSSDPWHAGNIIKIPEMTAEEHLPKMADALIDLAEKEEIKAARERAKAKVAAMFRKIADELEGAA